MLLISAILLALKGIITRLVYRGFSAGGNSGSAMVASIGSTSTTVDPHPVHSFFGRLDIRHNHSQIGIQESHLHLRRIRSAHEKGHIASHRELHPLRQIQDVDIDRTLTLQFMGLSKLTIITAGHEEAAEHEKVEVVIEPIQKEVPKTYANARAQDRRASDQKRRGSRRGHECGPAG